MAKVDIRAVAAAAGVSVGTVSNVLNRPHLVAESRRAEVRRAIAELGFVRNESARQLRSGTSRTVGLVVMDVANPFFTELARGVQDAASDADVSVILCNSDQRMDKQRRFLHLLEEHRVMGVLITPVLTSTRGLSELAQRGMPVVCVDRALPRTMGCSVSVDDRLGGRLGAQHLIDQGHRRIAFVGGTRTVSQVRDRFEGASTAVLQAGLHETALTHVSTTNLSFASGRESVAQLLAIDPQHRPTGAFFANDLLAIGALQELTRLGLRVPADLALIGYDDIDFAGAAAVPLTSVRQPARTLGERAMALLLEEAEGRAHQHRRLVLTPELVVRPSSTATVPRSPSAG